MRDVRGEGQEKRLPSFSHMARWCSLSEVFRELRVLCVRRTPLYVGCWLCPSGSKLLPPEVTSARVMFFVEKRLPPFLTGCCLGVAFERCFFHCRGNARKFCFFFGKMSPPFLARCCLGGCRMMDAEGSDRKTSPPFWHPSFDSFEVYWFCFPWHLVHLAEGFLFCTYCALVPKVFGSDLLGVRSPLAFVLHLLCL